MKIYSLKWLEKPRLFRFLVNLWPPLWGAGIAIRELSDDWTHAKVTLTLRFYNLNSFKTHYGGSLYSMTDMMYPFMLLRHIGKDHVIWDKFGEIEYIKPGRGVVTAEFDIDQQRIDHIVEQAANNRSHLEPFDIDIIDEEGDVVARAKRTVYVRRKDRKEDPK